MVPAPSTCLGGYMTSIYVPGKGLMDTTLLSIEKALTEYDERL